jgi:hypothetical protein
LDLLIIDLLNKKLKNSGKFIKGIIAAAQQHRSKRRSMGIRKTDAMSNAERPNERIPAIFDEHIFYLILYLNIFLYNFILSFLFCNNCVRVSPCRNLTMKPQKCQNKNPMTMK